MPVGTVSCHWATHTRNGKGKRKRKKKPEETEKNPREGGGGGGGKGRKSRELKNTEKQKDRRINKESNGLSVPQRPQAFGQAADTLERSCLSVFLLFCSGQKVCAERTCLLVPAPRLCVKD